MAAAARPAGVGTPDRAGDRPAAGVENGAVPATCGLQPRQRILEEAVGWIGRRPPNWSPSIRAARGWPTASRGSNDRAGSAAIPASPAGACDPPGDEQQVFAALAGSADIEWHVTPRRTGSAEGMQALRDSHAELLAAGTRPKAEALTRFRILCALREGPPRPAQPCGGTGPVRSAGRKSPYAGRPISSPATTRYWPVQWRCRHPRQRHRRRPLRAWSARSDGGLRAFLPAQLPAHETAYAMTVHKAVRVRRGRTRAAGAAASAADARVPYTAASRARRRLVVEATPEVVSAALARQPQRFNGPTSARAERVADPGVLHAALSAPRAGRAGERRQRRHANGYGSKPSAKRRLLAAQAVNWPGVPTSPRSRSTNPGVAGERAATAARRWCRSLHGACPLLFCADAAG